LIEPLQKRDFRIWKQTRTGLLSYPVNPISAKAHLSASIYLQMALKPHIVHVVGFSEADHAASSEDVIESCILARQVIEEAMNGAPDMCSDRKVQTRVNWLVKEAEITLQAIKKLSHDDNVDPLTDPQVLTKSVTCGIMDAPHLRNNLYAKGQIVTQIINGSCVPINPNGKPISEIYRIDKIFETLGG